MEKVSKGIRIVLLLTVIIGGYVALFYVPFEFALIISILAGSLLGMVIVAIKVVPPRKVMIVRNKKSGKLSPRIGLTFVIPFIEEVFKILDCRPIVEAPISVKAITREGQEVELSIQRVFWIDALESEKEEFKDGEKGKKRAVLAAIKIPGEKEEMMKEIKILVNDFTQAHLERLVAKVTFDDLENDTIPEGFNLKCPKCGKLLKSEKAGEFPAHCTCDAKWGKGREISFPQTLLALISIGASIWVDYELAKFGIGCEIRVLNLKPPKGLAEAKLQKEVMEAEQKVKKAELEVKKLEGKMINTFSKEMNISPKLVYFTESILKIIDKLLEKKKEKGGEEK